MCDDCMDSQAAMYQDEAEILLGGIESALEQSTASDIHATLTDTLTRWRVANGGY